jgi:hypothetical protein
LASVESYFDSDDEGAVAPIARARLARPTTAKPILSLDSPAPKSVTALPTIPHLQTHAAVTDADGFARPLPVPKKAKTRAAPKARRAGDSPYEPYTQGYSSGEDDVDNQLEFDSRPVTPSGAAAQEDDEEPDDDDDESDDDNNTSYAVDDTPAPRAPGRAARQDEYEASFVVDDDDDEADEADDGRRHSEDELDGADGALGFTPMVGALEAGRKRGADGRIRSQRERIAPLRPWLGERLVYVPTGENAMPRVEVVRVKTPPVAKTQQQQRHNMDKEQRRRVRQFEGAASPEVDVGGDAGEELLKVAKREDRLQYAPLSSKSNDSGRAAAVYNAPSGQFAVRSVVLPAGAVLRVNKKTVVPSHSFFVVNGQCTVQMLDEFNDLTEFGCRAHAHFFVPAGFKGRIENTSKADVRLNHYVFNG